MEASTNEQSAASRLNVTNPAGRKPWPQDSQWPLSNDPQRRYQVFMQAVQELLAAPDQETILKNIVHPLVPDFADWCVVNTLAPNGDNHRLSEARMVSAAANEALDEIRRRFPLNPQARIGLSHVMRTGCSERYHASDADYLERSLQICDDPEYHRLWQAVGVVSCIGVPLKIRGAVIGALGFLSLTPERRYSADDLDFAEELGRVVSLALDRSYLHNEALVASRLKDEFLASLSHELRTPMTSILGWTQILLEHPASYDIAVDSPLFQALAIIERNAAAQTTLIENILDMSSMVRGHIQLDRMPIDLRTVLTGVVDALRPTAAAKNLTLNLSFDSSAWIIGDQARLQQAIFNLAANAAKFTPAGGHIAIALTTQRTHYSITVRDNGIGIEASFLPFVFDRFRQQDSTASREYGGLGLGLALARDLIELHSGSINVESPGVNQGTTFTLVLPRA